MPHPLDGFMECNEIDFKHFVTSVSDNHISRNEFETTDVIHEFYCKHKKIGMTIQHWAHNDPHLYMLEELLL